MSLKCILEAISGFGKTFIKDGGSKLLYTYFLPVRGI